MLAFLGLWQNDFLERQDYLLGSQFQRGQSKVAGRIQWKSPYLVGQKTEKWDHRKGLVSDTTLRTPSQCLTSSRRPTSDSHQSPATPPCCTPTISQGWQTAEQPALQKVQGLAAMTTFIFQEQTWPALQNVQSAMLNQCYGLHFTNLYCSKDLCLSMLK